MLVIQILSWQPAPSTSGWKMSFPLQLTVRYDAFDTGIFAFFGDL